MAFLEIKNKKDFVLKFIQNEIVERKVSLDEVAELQKAEVRRVKDWEEWNDFQMAYRRKADRILLEELGESFEAINEKHIINNSVNDLDIQEMKASFDKRTRYVRRLKYILFLVTDQEYAVVDGIKYNMQQIYDLLLQYIKEDAENEIQEQLAIDSFKLDINEMNIAKENKYFLQDRRKEKLEKEIVEFNELLGFLRNGGGSLREKVPDILNLCNVSAIKIYKSIYNVDLIKEDNLEANSSEFGGKTL